MRLERLIIKNFRQYRNLDLSFINSKSNDLFIIIGKNGMGKTTLLNAINWCLYAEEPHSAESSEKLPLLNIKTIEESYGNDEQEVCVELWVSTDGGSRVIFKRTQNFRIHGDNKVPIPQANDFKVFYTYGTGDTNIIEGNDAQMCAESFVPSAIKEFFFFDGERLDNYFKEVKGQNIKNQIFILSHIYLLDNMQNRLETLSKELRRKSGKLNPEIDKIREKLEAKQLKLKEVDLKIEKIEKQIKLADDLIKEYEDKLKDLPNASELELERENLKNRRDEIGNLKNDKEKERTDFLLEYGRLIFLWPAINKSLNIIDEKKKNREIPPTIDKGLLERIVETEKCDVCGRTLDFASKKRVEELLKTVQLSSEVVGILHAMENPLVNAADKLREFKRKREEIQNQIKLYNEELQDLNFKISNIDQKLSAYDVESIKKWHHERLTLEEQKKNNIFSLGSAKEQKKILNKEKEQLEKEYGKTLEKEKQAREIKKQLEFCKKALKIIKKCKKEIMDNTKSKIESETNRIFFDLLWKTETFRDVKIDENYNINLIHSKGYNCIGSISAAERELLALSFTLALHRISGYDSPLLIDTPVARVSDDHRENFADIFLEVSKSKQIILLFTPAEYSEEIKETLEGKINAIFEINLQSHESEAEIEVIT